MLIVDRGDVPHNRIPIVADLDHAADALALARMAQVHEDAPLAADALSAPRGEVA